MTATVAVLRWEDGGLHATAGDLSDDDAGQVVAFARAADGPECEERDLVLVVWDRLQVLYVSVLPEDVAWLEKRVSCACRRSGVRL